MAPEPNEAAKDEMAEAALPAPAALPDDFRTYGHTSFDPHAPAADGVRTAAGRAREALVYRLQACARKYPDFPEAGIWLDNLDAIEAEAALPAAGLDVDDVRAALHRAGIGCKPNIPYCRATHRGHAQRIVDELIARLRGGA